MTKNNEILNHEKIKPLFKYIGGKSWLREQLREKILESISNKHIDTYVEPFTGGLGSFLNVYDILIEKNIKNIILSDINEILINTYKLIKNNPTDFIIEYLKIESAFANNVNQHWKLIKEKNELKLSLKKAEIFFNNIKKDFNTNKNNIDIVQSARLVFLQKHSFNGIYRENSKGFYNTPFNWSGSNMLNTIEDKVLEISELFNKCNINFIFNSFENLDYNSNTLYYLDPPYINEEVGENKYNKDIFTVEQQILLINKIKNTTFVYSNHKSKILEKEFLKLENINTKEISRKNIMSSNKDSRKEDKIELLINTR